MKVKLLCSRSGDRFTQQAGDIIEVSETEASALVAGNLAEPVNGALRTQKPETAVDINPGGDGGPEHAVEVDLNKMTKRQLHAFGKTELGMEFGKKLNKEELAEAVKMALEKQNGEE